ncbi:methyltransferase [Crossiella sp. CA-258035]|uniref:HemK2/MTQ2 family protein methyltransferase n=1 Tax=Crossiella sp. CA-258035 TaxID=2981138 RepID=UPI0024BD274E|nr:HemK2/MTQ2 family protein methyltransferase [Crossiella sp. CA-258035]WHT16006.1 methyltransferase [Crossiella sp. CA-258035]
MELLRSLGVYAPQRDTTLLVDAMLAAPFPTGARVLDVGTGSGALAEAAAVAGAAEVTAIDVSRRAVLTARLRTLRHWPRVRIRRGDMRFCLRGKEFDLVLANPPYVPAVRPGLPERGPARAWDAGPDGRALLDPLCTRAPELLAPKGTMLLVQSALAGTEDTLDRLRAGGLKAAVVARDRIPYGPVLRERAEWLVRNGFTDPGEDEEELVVIRADRTR